MLNKEEFVFLGITKFHEAGYTGKNVTIASKESILKGVFDDVECDDYFLGRSDGAMHGTNVMDYIRQVVPDARKIAVDMSGSVRNNIWNCEGMEKLLENPPDVLTSSNYSRNDSKEHHMVKYRELRDKGCLLVSGAGNSGEDGVLEMVKNDVFKAIGMCRFKDGKVERARNSSVGPEVDFMSIDNLYTTWEEKRQKGTSFASPVFAGMVALVQDFFITNTGEKLNNEQLLYFIKDNCIDLGEEGKDDSYGYGLFILPDPATINIYKYGDFKKFKDNTEYKKAIEYLVEQNEMNSPERWKERIKKDNDVDLMWFCIKWANAVARSK